MSGAGSLQKDNQEIKEPPPDGRHVCDRCTHGAWSIWPAMDAFRLCAICAFVCCTTKEGSGPCLVQGCTATSTAYEIQRVEHTRQLCILHSKSLLRACNMPQPAMCCRGLERHRRNVECELYGTIYDELMEKAPFALEEGEFKTLPAEKSKTDNSKKRKLETKDGEGEQERPAKRPKKELPPCTVCNKKLDFIEKCLVCDKYACQDCYKTCDVSDCEHKICKTCEKTSSAIPAISKCSKCNKDCCYLHVIGKERHCLDCIKTETKQQIQPELEICSVCRQDGRRGAWLMSMRKCTVAECNHKLCGMCPAGFRKCYLCDQEFCGQHMDDGDDDGRDDDHDLCCQCAKRSKETTVELHTNGRPSSSSKEAKEAAATEPMTEAEKQLKQRLVAGEVKMDKPAVTTEKKKHCCHGFAVNGTNFLCRGCNTTVCQDCMIRACPGPCCKLETCVLCDASAPQNYKCKHCKTQFCAKCMFVTGDSLDSSENVCKECQRKLHVRGVTTRSLSKRPCCKDFDAKNVYNVKCGNCDLRVCRGCTRDCGDCNFESCAVCEKSLAEPKRAVACTWCDAYGCRAHILWENDSDGTAFAMCSECHRAHLPDKHALKSSVPLDPKVVAPTEHKQYVVAQNWSKIVKGVTQKQAAAVLAHALKLADETFDAQEYGEGQLYEECAREGPVPFFQSLFQQMISNDGDKSALVKSMQVRDDGAEDSDQE